MSWRILDPGTGTPSTVISGCNARSRCPAANASGEWPASMSSASSCHAGMAAEAVLSAIDGCTPLFRLLVDMSRVCLHSLNITDSRLSAVKTA